MQKNIYTKNSFTYAENDDSSGIRYLTEVNLAWFRSQLETFRMSSLTEELWYNDILSMDDYIYIYIYIYIAQILL